jgi:DNA-binding response OmpR family regulator
MTIKRILVAEDNKLILDTVVFKLQKEGYEVVKANDGMECLQYLKSGSYDLLITDLFMPFVSGHEIISIVRSEMKSDLPILVLSAAGAEETVLKAFEMGADDYMIKPFSLGELSIRVKKILVSKRS